MSVNSAGRVVCDKCGGDLQNGNITEAVVITALTEDSTVRNFHLCLLKDDTHKRCATSVLTKTALAAYNDNSSGGPLALFDPKAKDEQGTDTRSTPEKRAAQQDADEDARDNPPKRRSSRKTTKK